MLGALALALADRIATRAEAASRLHDSAASALVGPYAPRHDA